MNLPVPMFICSAPQGPGVLWVNGRIAGEIPEGGKLSFPLSDGVQYLTWMPFYEGDLPMTCRLALLGGRWVLEEQPSSGVSVVAWPGSIFDVTLIPSKAPTYRPISRRILDQLRWQDAYGMHRATLYEEDGIWLDMESDDGARLYMQPSAKPLQGQMELVDQHVHVLGPMPKDGEYLLIAKRSQSGFDVVFDGAGDSVSCAGNTVRVLANLDDLVGHGVLYSYDLQSQVEDSMECIWVQGHPRWPRTAFDTVCAFVEAVCLDQPQEALGYLSEEVRSRVTFEELQTHFGDYDGWEPPRYVMEQAGISLALTRSTMPNFRTVDIFRFQVRPSKGEQGDFEICTACLWESEQQAQKDVFS